MNAHHPLTDQQAKWDAEARVYHVEREPSQPTSRFPWSILGMAALLYVAGAVAVFLIVAGG